MSCITCPHQLAARQTGRPVTRIPDRLPNGGQVNPRGPTCERSRVKKVWHGKSPADRLGMGLGPSHFWILFDRGRLGG